MKDVFRDYKTHKLFTHLGIIGMSFALALWVNMYLGTTSSWEMLTASVLDATSQTPQADFIATAWDNTIEFQHTKPLQDIVSISFSLAYNPDNIEFETPTTPDEAGNVLPVSDESGFSTYMIEYAEPMNSLSAGTLMTLPYTKKDESQTDFINVVNVYATDSQWETYFLSTQGVTL